MRGSTWVKAWQWVLRAGMGVALAAAASAVRAQAVDIDAELRGQSASASVLAVARHVLDTADHHGRSWAVVDKRHARLFVFDGEGRLVGATPALLGSASGDGSAPGVGPKAASYIPPEERTTPAGRFVARPGVNLTGEAVVWIDYAAAVALHRLRPAPAHEKRPQRLASATADDNRITLGCVVVDETFYDNVVAPQFGRRSGVVYVLPETRDWASLFDNGAAAL